MERSLYLELEKMSGKYYDLMLTAMLQFLYRKIPLTRFKIDIEIV